jgi:hypothetical protein
MQFTDYDADKIAAKLKQVEEFEAKYGSNNLTKSWYKWCTSYEYRKREWQWRQGLANAHKDLTNRNIII